MHVNCCENADKFLKFCTHKILKMNKNENAKVQNNHPLIFPSTLDTLL